jgi:acetyl esterase/lipase
VIASELIHSRPDRRPELCDGLILITEREKTVQVDLHLEYSDTHTQKRRIDIFQPERPNGAAILFIHGGGWRGGAKEQWHAVALHFTQQGYVCASAGYRLIPDIQYPAPVEDVRLAMAWFRSRAEEFGFDANRIAAAGSSAGGHLVGLLATIAPDDDLGFSDEMPLRDTRPNAIAAYCPAMRMYKEEDGSFILPERRSDFFGDDVSEGLLRSASPIDRITGEEPPFLFIHGDADDTIPLSVSEDMCARLHDKKVTARVEVLSGVGHGFGYGVHSDPQKKSIEVMADFLEQVLGTKQ